MASPQEILERALALQAAGNPGAAAGLYGVLLRGNPDHPDLLHLAGTAFHQLGKSEDAERLIRAAVERQPKDPAFHHNLAVVLQALERIDEAADAYQAAMNLDPVRVETLASLGGILAAKDQTAEGIALMRRALVLDPAHVEALGRLSNHVHSRSDHADSLRWRRRARAVDPLNAANLVALGLVLIDLEQGERARDIFHAAAIAHPATAEAYNHCGYLEVARLRIDEAVRMFHRASCVRPDLSSAFAGLSEAAFAAGDLQTAISWMRRALEIAPGEPHYRFRLGIQLLAAGDMADGWQYYQWIRMKSGSVRRPDGLHLWKAQPASEASILVGADQGVGDELLHAACFKQLAQDVGRLVIECDQRIVALMRRSFPDALVLAYHRTGVPARPEHGYEWVPADWSLDYYIDGAALMARCRGTVAQADAAAGPWLVPDPDRVAEMRAHLDALPPGPKVGVAWRSRRLTTFRLPHYPGLAPFEQVFKVAGAQFVSLQYGVGWRQELADTGVPVAIIPDLDTTDDIDGVLALIAALDLVICPSSTVGWLAASLGKPVWLMYNTPVFLEYGTDRFPGFPSVRSFRKTQVEPWRPLLASVAEALRAEVATPSWPSG